MKLIRKIMTAVVATAAIGGGLAVSAPALASTASVQQASVAVRTLPHSPFVPYAKMLPRSIPSSANLVLTDGNGTWGATAEGVGNQVDLTQTATNWVIDETQTNIWKIKPSGNTSHCWEQVGNEIQIQNCSQGNSGQQFSFDGNGPVNIQNTSSNAFAGVFNPNANKPVWCEGSQGGYYISWTFE